MIALPGPDCEPESFFEQWARLPSSAPYSPPLRPVGGSPCPSGSDTRCSTPLHRAHPCLSGSRNAGWTQDNGNADIKALSTKGHKAFGIYPADPAGANGLLGELRRNTQIVAAYGAGPTVPTSASFTVVTDTKGAAMLAAGDARAAAGLTWPGSVAPPLPTPAQVVR
jgi:hypothetical protein